MSFFDTHRKFIVTLIGAILIGLNSFWGIEIGITAEAWTNTLIAVAAAFGMERVGNKTS